MAQRSSLRHPTIGQDPNIHPRAHRPKKHCKPRATMVCMTMAMTRQHSMTHTTLTLALLLLGFTAKAHCAQSLTLSSPSDYQVVQRSSPGKGLLRFTANLSEDLGGEGISFEARFTKDGQDSGWLRAGGSLKNRQLTGQVEAPAGGWWRMDLRLSQNGKSLTEGSVQHVGVGEVFVIAGQSNSANHGEEKQRTQSGLVAAFNAGRWQIAHDPQPGASGGGGSFIPAFADAVVAREKVPVGIVACGIGATSVREWLPKGSRFPNPPTLLGRVQGLQNGEWMSKGDAYAMLVQRMKALGPQGFRALLWHQGESDANQKDGTRTLSGNLYAAYLQKIINDSRRDIGWQAPWFVAQASYHVPGDEGSEDIRAAQASLWRADMALQGPDSDALKGMLRERKGQGVHFSGEGLRAHGEKWAQKVLPWLEAQWTAPRPADGGREWSRFEPLPECHSLGWVGAHVQNQSAKAWDGVLDEAKWGRPSAQQVLSRQWDWRISDEQWQAAVKQAGEGRREEVRFDLWVPDALPRVRGIVVISGHGSGESLFKRADLRALAKELGLALFKFIGNPMQRGFWPRSLLFDRLKQLGEASGHPELAQAPLFLYGHSNGTGFSAILPAYAPQRVWGFVSMRPGITFQVYQPAAAMVPGLIIFGEDDPFLARPSKEENLAVVPALRRNHGALWNIAVEPKSGHGPGEATWPLVYSFLRHSFEARVPTDNKADGTAPTLRVLSPESGHLGQNWDSSKGGYQALRVGPKAEFSGDQASASWLLNEAYARDWQAFQREGRIGSKP